MSSPVAKHTAMSIKQILDSAQLSPDQSHMQLSIELDQYAELQKACEALPAPARTQSIVQALTGRVLRDRPNPSSATPSLSPPSSPRRTTVSSPEPIASPPETVILPPLLLVNEQASNAWYHGLSTRPRLLATTQTEDLRVFPIPSPFPKNKMISPPDAHPIVSKWRFVALAVESQLTADQVAWTTIDLVRIGVEGEPDHPLVIWIGITPGTLDFASAREVLGQCVSLLRQGFPNISSYAIELREASLALSAAQQHPAPCEVVSPNSRFEKDYARVYARTAMAPGLRIAPLCNQDKWGSAGFFLRNGNSLYLVTARHVLNRTDPSETRVVFEPGIRSAVESPVDQFLEVVDTYVEDVGGALPMIRIRAQQAEALLEMRGDVITSPLALAFRADMDAVGKTESCLEQAKGFRQYLTSSFLSSENRIIGHIEFAPPISVYKGFLFDVGLIRLDPGVILDGFRGNIIDLNSAPFDQVDFASVTRHPYPAGGLIRIESVLESGSDLRANAGRKVVLAGARSRNTIGSLGVASRIRLSDYRDDVPGEQKAWAVPVLPAVTWCDDRGLFAVGYNRFSSGGDSGGMVVTTEGELVGVLIAGIGAVKDETNPQSVSVPYDISYLTPAKLILDSLRHQNSFREITLDLANSTE